MKPILMMALAIALSAQQPAAFEVANVKPSTTNGPSSMSTGRGQFRMQNHSLRALIQSAYKLQDYAYSGPPWAESAFFDVVAKMPEGAKQWNEMLQTLLAERFKLAVHWEDRDMPGLSLSVDKKGPRIQPVEPGPGGTSWGDGLVQINKGSLSDFARLLSGAMLRPVEDATGLTGAYDIRLRWLPDGPLPADTTGMSSSVYEAVSSLGLKLQRKQVRVPVLIVDHVER